MLYPKSIQKLIDLFAKFPTVGPRTASRFVFYLLKLSKQEIQEISDSIKNLKNEIKLCSFCFYPFSADNQELCEICRNPVRNKKILCIVEKEADVLSLEKTGKFKGRYFVLGGTISNFKKKDISDLRFEELKKIINHNPEIEEIIIAINPTTEGEATILYLERLFKKNLPKEKKITRLGRGLPIGGEVEYADEETLSSALENRH